MSEIFNPVHHAFKLNGVSYTSEELKEVGYDLIKEGEVYEMSIGDFVLDWLSEEPYVLVKTSGSTGTPKFIQLRKQHMVNSARATASFFDLGVGTTALCCLPCDYISGKMMLVRALVNGWKLDYIAPSSSPLGASSKDYDFCAMVPLQVQNDRDRLERVRTLIVGGGPFPKPLKEQLVTRSTKVYETYGMTETVSHIALKPVNSGKSDQQYFTTLPGVNISQDDRDCLKINAPHISEGIVQTNDIVELISEKEFIWLGRYDSLINSGGVKLIPEDIEQRLRPHFNFPFFLAGLPDVLLGEKLVMVIEGTFNHDEVYEKLRSIRSLQKYEMPKQLLGLPKFVRTDNGKIQRKKSLNGAMKTEH